MFYDSSMYSTPLSLLQLPPTALPEVTQKLTQPGNTTARFSQDGKGLEDLQGVVSPADHQQAAEAEVDVGYVCKKCQLVHPAEALCLSHQRSSGCCGKEPTAAVLRLVQVQLECRACRERLPTLLDFKFHCGSERHVKRLHRLQQQQTNSLQLPTQNQQLHKLQQQNQQQTNMHKVQLSQQNQQQTNMHKVQQLQQNQQTDLASAMKPPSCSTSSHFAATPVAPSMSAPPRLAPPPLLLPQTGNDVPARNGGPDVAAQHLLFSSDFRNDLDAALRLGLEASSTPLDALPAAKGGMCYGGEATLSPETKRL